MRKINFYYHESLTHEFWIKLWPDDLMKLFKTHQGDSLAECFCFENNSKEEKDFIKTLESRNIRYKKEEITDLYDHKKACVISDSYSFIPIDKMVRIDLREVMSHEDICDSSSGSYCDIGIKQIKKVVLPKTDAPNKDIFLIEGSSPTIIIVSNKFREAVIKTEIDSVEFIPCLNSVSGYNNDELKFETKIEGDFDHYQMIPKNKLEFTPRFDWLVSDSPCEKCDSIFFYLSYHNLRFYKEKMLSDFYLLDEGLYKDKKFYLRNQLIIFSSKLLDIAVSKKLKGIGKAYDDFLKPIYFPEIKYFDTCE